MRDPALPVYVVDTHALYCYRRVPSRLSAAADAVFRLASAGEAYVIVPAIVVAEMFYLTQKAGAPISPAELIGDIRQSREFVFSDLGQPQLERIADIAGISEMHDRLIVAEALVYRAALVSRDEVVRDSGAVPVIW